LAIGSSARGGVCEAALDAGERAWRWEDDFGEKEASCIGSGFFGSQVMWAASILCSWGAIHRRMVWESPANAVEFGYRAAKATSYL
jgi:hypothetical protein